MIKHGYERLAVGDGTLTRRVLKRCRHTGVAFETETEFVKIGRHQYGTKTTGYIVPKNILDEERARRTSEQRIAEEKKALELEERRVAVRQRQIDEVAAEFPQLTLKTVQQLVDSERAIYSEREVGYQFGIGIKTYWNQLGFAVTGKPTGYLVRGKRVLDTYSSHQLGSRNSRMTVARLKRKWLKKYGTEELVLAQAIRTANKLQKVKRIAEFYPLKDQWIKANQHKLVEGRVTRVETKSCWSCGGTGQILIWDDDYFEDDCPKCDGSGVFSSRTLYEHAFLIDCTRFCFHSYIRPKVVIAEQQADGTDKAFGRPFDKDELPVPPQSVIIELIHELMPTTDKPICCTARERIQLPKTSLCLRVLRHTQAAHGV